MAVVVFGFLKKKMVGRIVTETLDVEVVLYGIWKSRKCGALVERVSNFQFWRQIKRLS